MTAVEHKDRSKVGTLAYRWDAWAWVDDEPELLASGEQPTHDQAEDEVERTPAAEWGTITRGVYRLDPDENEVVDGTLVEWVTWEHDEHWQADGERTTPSAWTWTEAEL